MVNKMKKIITVILIMVMVFNFICSNSYAMSQSAIEGIMKDGTTTNPQGQKQEISIGDSITGTIVGLLIGGIDVIPMTLHAGLTIIALSGGVVKDTGEYSVGGAFFDKGIGSLFLTVEKVIFGRYFLVKADFDVDEHNAVEKIDRGLDVSFSNALITFKDTAKMWYYILRLITLVLSILTLIYVGIRMATSTIASDQVKYKKMLMGWFEALGIIVLLPYIINIILKFNSIFVNMAITLKDALINSGKQSFEANILESVFSLIKATGGFTVAMYSVVYWFLVFIELKFFFMYVKRNFSVVFLTIIAPLITVTYPIDKAGDGKAQAFGNWLSEFIITVFIQTLHVYTYLIFMFLAGDIAIAAPVVGIAFLYALPRIEKIIKIIFNLRGGLSIKDLKDTMKMKG